MTGSVNGQVFTDTQVQHILKQVLGEQQPWEVLSCTVKRAAVGLTGFLGDHFRATLRVRCGDAVKEVQLFVKSMPRNNQSKASFIDEGNFFRREMIAFEVFQSVGGDGGSDPWRTKAYIYNESLLVMPDLAALGYTQRPHNATLDLPHVRVVTASIARFHAAYANYATHKTRNGHRYNFLDDYRDLMEEPNFKDSPWIRAGGKLSANMLHTFSKKYNKDNIPDLEDKLIQLFIKACDSLKYYKNTLNVLLHKDLWMNNIMFKYDGETPINALLIDFQCMRYGPPAFDLTIFLYLTTSRSFRYQYEKEIFRYYYDIFNHSLTEVTKLQLKGIRYDFEEFLLWCERSRMFGILEAVTIFPYVLMSPVAASHYFDDPATFDKYCFEDRTGPVLEYCQKCEVYRDRQVVVTEEFVERYLCCQ